LLDGYAVCACPNLVYRSTKPVMYPWDDWEVLMTSELRCDLVQRAKQKIGLDITAAAAPENVTAAIEAARMIGEHGFADDMAYEQWVALL